MPIYDGIDSLVGSTPLLRLKKLAPEGGAELRHRLAGYGYGLEDTSEGMIVTKLPFGNALCMVPKIAAAA